MKMDTNPISSLVRLNMFCKLMEKLLFFPILIIILEMISPVLFYLCGVRRDMVWNYSDYSILIVHSINIDLTKLSTWQMALVISIDTFIIAIFAYAFILLRLLFLSYSKSEYFSVSSATYLCKFAKSLVAWVMMQLLAEPLISFIASLNYPPSERYFMLSFNGKDLLLLFPSLSIMIISLILKKVCQINEKLNSAV
jgi:hypothetical protein